MKAHKITEHWGYQFVGVKEFEPDRRGYGKINQLAVVPINGEHRYQMEYVQYEMQRNQKIDEIDLSELLWKFFQKEDVVYVHPHTSSLCGIIVLPTKETAEQYRAKSMLKNEHHQQEGEATRLPSIKNTISIMRHRQPTPRCDPSVFADLSIVWPILGSQIMTL
ncbi:unnamed protein product [Rodentolepis nana]|uniref:Transposase n=1 Tax=Rodentolepis nana TaxID=102285 RepID=A0A0R3TLY3_RODNA|nr:unnamed protein product [Rodentolepis nana]